MDSKYQPLGLRWVIVLDGFLSEMAKGITQDIFFKLINFIRGACHHILIKSDDFSVWTRDLL